MAGNTETDVVRSRRLTLNTTDVDSITFKQAWDEVVVTNEDASEILTVTTDGTAPTAGGDDMFYVPPQSSMPLPMEGLVVKVIGSGNVYSVVGR